MKTELVPPSACKTHLLRSISESAVKLSELVTPLAVNLGPIPLEPGRYVWRLLIDGEPDDNARAREMKLFIADLQAVARVIRGLD